MLSGLLGALTVSLLAEPVTYYGAPYQATKDAVEARVLSGKTLKVEDILHAKYGTGGIQRLFPNGISLDSSIPGVKKTALLATSGNHAQAKGHLRELLYADQIAKREGCQVLALNEAVVVDGVRVTDADVRARVGVVRVRMEIKDLRPSSQRADLPRLKRQISHMASQMKRGDEVQALVNRHAVIPEVKEFARSLGIQCYENVATGRKSLRKQRTIDFTRVLEDIETKGAAHVRAAGAGRVHAGRGLTASKVASGPGLSRLALLELGRDVDRAGVMRSSRGVRAGSDLRVPASSPRLVHRTLFRATGRAASHSAGVLVVAEQAYRIHQYARGSLSDRQFVGSLAGGGGFLAGAAAGAAIGAWMGGWGAIPGFLIGGVSGMFALESAAGVGFDHWVALKDEAVEAEFKDWVYREYGVASGLTHASTGGDPDLSTPPPSWPGRCSGR